jgi:hypothetical protein
VAYWKRIKKYDIIFSEDEGRRNLPTKSSNNNNWKGACAERKRRASETCPKLR